MPETGFFTDLGLLFLAALGGGLLAHWLRQPLIVGYILAGVLIGPFTPGPTLSDPHTFQLFAEIGVVLLMFSIGVEFSLEELLQVRKVALLGAPVGIALIVFLTIPLGKLLGWTIAQSLLVGATISVASTMVLLKFLLERGELATLHGRVVVGITLAEDLAVVAMTVLIPALASPGETRVAALGRSFLQALVLLGPLLWLARRVVPRFLAKVAHTRSMELFLLVALSIAIGTAALTASLGLSIALGAFLAGLIISESEFAHEALARVLPIRDIFVAIFFISVGTLIRPASVLSELPAVVALVLLVVAGKFAVWALVIRGAGYPAFTAVTAALGLTQIGEFSYILAGVARDHGLLTRTIYDAVLATSLITILLNALIFRRTPAWLERLLSRKEPPPPTSPAVLPEGHVIICGFGRVGREVADALDAFHVPYTVVDLDPEATRAALGRGAGSVFGDAGKELILQHAGVGRARLAVVAIPEFEAVRRCVATMRGIRGDLPILARVHQQRHRATLGEAGATEVIQPEVEAALTIVRHSLDLLGVDHRLARRYLEGARAYWPEAMRTEGMSGEALQAQEVDIRSRALGGQSIEQTHIRERSGVAIVSITRADGHEIVNPRSDERLQAGDRLLAIGSKEQLDLLRHICGAEGDPDYPG
ncbi:MAG: cation:proton antiporter [Armatimonadetes bacterium]|nr:cation:proton antiporter [Armatimonadota bacterium]